MEPLAVLVAHPKGAGDHEITNTHTTCDEVAPKVLEQAASIQGNDVVNGALKQAHSMPGHRNMWADINPNDTSCKPTERLHSDSDSAPDFGVGHLGRPLEHEDAIVKKKGNDGGCYSSEHQRPEHDLAQCVGLGVLDHPPEHEDAVSDGEAAGVDNIASTKGPDMAPNGSTTAPCDDGCADGSEFPSDLSMSLSPQQVELIKRNDCQQEIRELDAWMAERGSSLPLSPQQFELFLGEIDKNDAELLKVKGKCRRHRNRK